MLTLTLILLALAMIPPASKAIAEAINRTCVLDMWEISLANNLKLGKLKIGLPNGLRYRRFAENQPSKWDQNFERIKPF